MSIYTRRQFKVCRAIALLVAVADGRVLRFLGSFTTYLFAHICMPAGKHVLISTFILHFCEILLYLFSRASRLQKIMSRMLIQALPLTVTPVRVTLRPQ